MSRQRTFTLQAPYSHQVTAVHGVQTPERIVLHSTESPGAAGRACEGVYSYWRRQARGYGAHFVVAANGDYCRTPNANELLWHVENHNTGSVGIEQCGYARYSREDWLDNPAQLDTVARIIAHLSVRWGIVLRNSVNSGVCTHAQCSKAFGGSHTDPGAGYPFSHVLGMAQAYKKAGGWYLDASV